MAGEIVVWTTVGLSLLVADIILQVQELYRMRPLPGPLATALTADWSKTPYR